MEFSEIREEILQSLRQAHDGDQLVVNKQFQRLQETIVGGFRSIGFERYWITNTSEEEFFKQYPCFVLNYLGGIPYNANAQGAANDSVTSTFYISTGTISEVIEGFKLILPGFQNFNLNDPYHPVNMQETLKLSLINSKLYNLEVYLDPNKLMRLTTHLDNIMKFRFSHYRYEKYIYHDFIRIVRFIKAFTEEYQLRIGGDVLKVKLQESDTLTGEIHGMPENLNFPLLSKVDCIIDVSLLKDGSSEEISTIPLLVEFKKDLNLSPFIKVDDGTQTIDFQALLGSRHSNEFSKLFTTIFRQMMAYCLFAGTKTFIVADSKVLLFVEMNVDEIPDKFDGVKQRWVNKTLIQSWIRLRKQQLNAKDFKHQFTSFGFRYSLFNIADKKVENYTPPQNALLSIITTMAGKHERNKLSRQQIKSIDERICSGSQSRESSKTREKFSRKHDGDNDGRGLKVAKTGGRKDHARPKTRPRTRSQAARSQVARKRTQTRNLDSSIFPIDFSKGIFTERSSNVQINESFFLGSVVQRMQGAHVCEVFIVTKKDLLKSYGRELRKYKDYLPDEMVMKVYNALWINAISQNLDRFETYYCSPEDYILSTKKLYENELEVFKKLSKSKDLEVPKLLGYGLFAFKFGLDVFDMYAGKFLLMTLIKPNEEITLKEIIENSDRKTRLKFERKAEKQLKALHRHGIVHNDVAIRNFIIDQKGKVNIIDFSHSFITDYKETFDEEIQDLKVLFNVHE